MNVLKLVVITLLGLLLNACAANSADPMIAFEGQSATQVYQRAKTALAAGHYEQAIKAYEALAVIYPFTPYSERAQLELAYSYYQENNSMAAQSTLNHFIQLYPRSQWIDYAYYLKAVVNMDQDRGWYLRYVPIDVALRDPGSMRQAYTDFDEFIRHFPQSRYVPDARQRLIYLRNTFAEYELQIADYYFRRKAYIAAANRAKDVVRNYQGAPAVEKALLLLIKSYRNLGLDDLANQSIAVYRLNFPGHPF